jgi:hypothetical protein
LVGVAVNVTLWPVHIEVVVDVILTEAVTEVLTVTVTAAEVAGLPVTPERLDVILQVIASAPAASVVLLKVEAVAPLIAVPLLYH